MDDVRLDRIEEKIDKLSEAATTVARIEERLIASTNRVLLLQSQVSKNTSSIKMSERFMWILITVCATALIYTFQGN